MSAIFGTFLLAGAAVKGINAASMSLFTVPSLSSTVPAVAAAGYTTQSRRYPGAAQSKSSSTLTLSAWGAETQGTEDLHPALGGNHTLLAVGAGLLSLAGIAGYLWQRGTGRRDSMAMLAAIGARPTLGDTKLRFLELSDSSIPNMYNIPLQELLAQHHLLRFSSKYQYDEVFALGIVTVINQLLEGLPQSESDRIQNAYFGALGDSATMFKADSADLEQWAATKGKDLSLSSDDATTAKLRAIASRVAAGNFQYSKFFSIGLFQLLQQSGATDPESFTNLVKEMSLDKERVTKDLKVYKDLLKRLEMAKDMKEKFLERERKKQQERLEKKAQAQATA